MFASVIALTRAATHSLCLGAARAGPPTRPMRVIALALLTWYATACKSDSTAPAAMHPQAPPIRLSVEACANDCTLLDGVAPFQRTRAGQDSVAAFVYIGEVTIRGTAGGTLDGSPV